MATNHNRSTVIRTTDTVTDKIQALRDQISKTEDQLQQLRAQLAHLEPESLPEEEQPTITTPPLPPPTTTKKATTEHNNTNTPWPWPLREEEYARYGRQLVLPQIGIKGQLNLRRASVLIIGAGGLGCPAAAYLAGSGIGRLGIVDGDVVESSNLHRQITHSTSRVGDLKVDSLVSFCRDLNPLVEYVSYAEHLTPENAERIVGGGGGGDGDEARGYDVVLDCTDHPTSRYLISDICVLLGKPLVSASALRTDGQLIVLNNPPAPQGSGEGGPCYRCVFPTPPPADSVVSCGEGGILGPVVGVMGVLQALEAIKLIAAGPVKEPATPSLLLFSASGATQFRSIRMRSRRKDCFACSAQSKLTLKDLASGSLDYVQFCGVVQPVDILRPDERVSAARYDTILREVVNGEDGKENKRPVLIDVREKEHFDIASIPDSINVPFSTFQARSRATRDDEVSQCLDWLPEEVESDRPIHVVCRLGNDSQVVTRKLKEMGFDQGGKRYIGDIKGGMKAWKTEVDHTVPFT
ncbi:adenylyltransferase [Xylariaceae sp. FL0255]|nr:adenylyltransferase [Xylariaceae sp. FL0255]